MTIDLSKRHADYATFLPAISSFFTELIGRIENVDGYLGDNRTPSTFEHGFRGLDFLSKDQSYYHYDKALYSAGHANLNMDRSKLLEHIIHERPKGTTVVGDSGGFQIGKGVIKFDWENFFERPGDMGYKGKADEVRHKILNWLEHTADWSMTLDVPAWAATMHGDRTGLKNFQECLDCTMYNNAWFQDNRLGKTKYLNVLQGTYWEDADQWYQAVKDFEFEGWGMGGNNMRDIHLALKRIIVMRDEGKLDGYDWLHFLGTSKLEWAIILTCVQRAIRKHINPNLTISFDAASPYIAAANGQIYTRNVITSKRLTYTMDRMFDDKRFSHFSPGNLSDIALPWDSPIGQRARLGDVLWYAPGMKNKRDMEGNTSWDAITYGIIMSHNVYQHITCVQEACALATIEFERHNIDWRTWEKTKIKNLNQESQWCPRNLLMFDTFVKELFDSDKPMDLLKQAEPFLDALSNNKLKDGDSSFKNSPASAFFDFPEEGVDEGEFTEAQAEKLDFLESELKDGD